MKLFSTKLEEDLRLGRVNKTKDEWIKYCLMAGAIVLAFAIGFGQISLAPLLGLLGFVVVYKYPWYQKKKIAGQIEKELPLALRSMATLLSIGLPFEQALKRCCDDSVLAKEINVVIREVKLGSSMPEAMTAFSERVESKQLRKAVMQLNSIYEKRGDSISLKKLSDEIVAVQKAALQEYSGKLVVYSLIFIAISAILPALFQAYVIVGSTFMTSMVTPEQAFWIPVAAFPVIDTIVLAFIRFKKPYFA